MKGLLRWRWKWAVAMWLCMAVSVATVAALPMIEAVAADSALATDLTNDPGLNARSGNVTTIGAFDAMERRIGSRVSGALGSAVVADAAYASMGPYHVTQVNGVTASAGAAQLPLTVSYVDHLAAHVNVGQGEIPPDALGGQSAAVTLPQAGADELGLHLNDTFCLSPGGGKKGWCGQVVGIWSPRDGADPVWGGSSPGLEVMVGRHDFFQLAGDAPSPPVAGVRYVPDPYRLDQGAVDRLAAKTQHLQAEPAGRSGLSIQTSMPASLRRYASWQLGFSRTLGLLTASLSLLSLALVGIVVSRFLQLQDREQKAPATSRRPSPPIPRPIVLALAGLAIPVGAAVGLLVASIPLFAGGASLAWLHPQDLIEALVTLGLGVAGLLVVVGVLVGRRRRSEARIAELPPPGGIRLSLRNRARIAVPLLLLGLGFLTAGRLGLLPLNVLTALSQVMGVALLDGAALSLLPFTVRLPQGGMAASLAGSQFGRQPDQHAGLAFLVILAVATLGVSAAAVAELPLHLGRAPGLLRLSLAIGGGLGLVAVILIALIGFGFYFFGVARCRVLEYASLFAVDLPPRTIAQSLAVEEAVVLRSSLVAGLAVAILALLALPSPPGGTVLAAVGVVATALMTVLLLVTGPMAGRPALRVGEPRE